MGELMALHRHSVLVLVLMSMVLAAGCREAASDPDQVASVGGEPILFADLASFYQQSVGDDWQGLESDVLVALFEQFLDERLLHRLAVDRGLIQEADDGRTALEALLESTRQQDAVSEAEISKRYRRQAARFELPERVELQQILVEDRATAERALSELAAGADFGEVARQLSTDPSAPYGGYQGELAREDLPVALAETIFSLAEGDVSEILEADYGFHIFLVARRLPAETRSLADARDEVRREIEVERADIGLGQLLMEARELYDVEIHQERLPFAIDPARSAAAPSGDDED